MDAANSFYSSHNNKITETPSDESHKTQYLTRESKLRTWIANNECICPYAPGLAKFTHLPIVSALNYELVRFLADEMKSFYEHKKKGERIERWMILPPSEWENHEYAKQECETLFWALQAAYYYLRNDRPKMKQAMQGSLPGYHKDQNGDISNPVIGHLAKKPCDTPHAKSLFCTGLSNIYRHNKHHRYAPSSVMVLVYASDFCEKKNDKALRHINVNIAHGNLIELFGSQLEIDLKQLKRELPIWEHIISKVLYVQGYRNLEYMNSEVMDLFRHSSDLLIEQILEQTCQAMIAYEGQTLGILKTLCSGYKMSPKKVIGGHFSGTGLYVIPSY